MIGRSHRDPDDENASDIREVENAVTTPTPTSTPTATPTDTPTPTPDPDGDRDAHADPDGHGHRDGDPDADRDGDAHADAYVDGDAHADGDADRNPDGDRHRDGDATETPTCDGHPDDHGNADRRPRPKPRRPRRLRRPRRTATCDYQCYEVHQGQQNATPATLDDLFGTGTISVRRAKRICTPADKNDENPGALAQIDHLRAYEINQTERFTPVKNLSVTNQFGTMLLNIARPDFILVPTSKSLDQTRRRRSCRRSTTTSATRSLATRLDSTASRSSDQFGTLNLDIKRPVRFCAARRQER